MDITRLSTRRAAVVLALTLGGLTAFAAPPKPAPHVTHTVAPHVTHTVTIDGTTFRPPSLTIALGDSVVWENKDPFPHTATAAGVFDSGRVAAGASWTFTPKAKGELQYVCTLHPTMKATLKVQ